MNRQRTATTFTDFFLGADETWNARDVLLIQNGVKAITSTSKIPRVELRNNLDPTTQQ